MLPERENSHWIISAKKEDIKFTHKELGRGSFVIVKKDVLFGSDVAVKQKNILDQVS